MLSIPHLIVIFVAVLVIFGPEKLPELARNLGKLMAEFRRTTGDLRSTLEGHMRDLEREASERGTAASSSSPGVSPTPATPAPPAISPASGTVPATAPHAAAVAAGENRIAGENASQQHPNSPSSEVPLFPEDPDDFLRSPVSGVEASSEPPAEPLSDVRIRPA